MWKLEENVYQSVVSFDCVSLRDWTYVLRVGSRHLYPLSHFVGFAVFSLLISDYFEAGCQWVSQTGFALFLQPRHILNWPSFPQLWCYQAWLSSVTLLRHRIKTRFVGTSPKSWQIFLPRSRVTEKWRQLPIPSSCWLSDNLWSWTWVAFYAHVWGIGRMCHCLRPELRSEASLRFFWTLSLPAIGSNNMWSASSSVGRVNNSYKVSRKISREKCSLKHSQPTAFLLVTGR